MSAALLPSNLRQHRSCRELRNLVRVLVAMSVAAVLSASAAENNPADDSALKTMTEDFLKSSGDQPQTVTTIDSLTGAEHISIPASTTLILDNPASNVFDGRFTGGGLFEKTGAGSLTFSSLSNVQNFNFAGTIQLDTSTLEFQGGSASGAMTIGTLDLSGGTLLLSDAYLNVKTLNITGNTILDFGTGAGSTLNATNIYIAAGATLTVKNWSSEIDFLFATSNFRQDDHSGTSADFNSAGSPPQNQIVFDTGGSAGSNQTAWINYNYGGYTNFEIRPIPEPSTYGLVFVSGCLGLLGWQQSRRRARKSRSP